MDEERKYTLAEAEAELRSRTCAIDGHSWNVISNFTKPVRVVCDSCGLSYSVGDRE